MKKILAVVAILLLVMVSGCKFFETEDDSNLVTGEIIEINPDDSEDEVIIIDDDMSTEEDVDSETSTEVEIIDDEDDVENVDGRIRVEGTEGELIVLRPDAYDPDGDTIRYSFSSPFNANGEWQTSEGDAGEYLVDVTASDGTLSTTETVLVVIYSLNKAPTIECADSIIVSEGETVEIECEIDDPEGESVQVTYSGWMTSATKETGFEDAGEYEVEIMASDGKRENSKTIEIIVEDVNRAPIVEEIADIRVMEGETVSVEVEAEDPDGDEIEIEYSELFDEDGTWETEVGDAGTYETYVSVTDGLATVKKDFNLIVTQRNTYPTLELIEPIEVDEGETITLDIDAYDREGDELTITVSGWMDDTEYTTTYEDAGEHIVTVTVSDGELVSSQDVEITVNDVNRAPVFKILA